MSLHKKEASGKQDEWCLPLLPGMAPERSMLFVSSLIAWFKEKKLISSIEIFSRKTLKSKKKTWKTFAVNGERGEVWFSLAAPWKGERKKKLLWFFLNEKNFPLSTRQPKGKGKFLRIWIFLILSLSFSHFWILTNLSSRNYLNFSLFCCNHQKNKKKARKSSLMRPAFSRSQSRSNLLHFRIFHTTKNRQKSSPFVGNRKILRKNNCSRVSVLRGQVITSQGLGIVGVRVSVDRDSRFGFTLTRQGGWWEPRTENYKSLCKTQQYALMLCSFSPPHGANPRRFDVMVNGGGAITLQFQRSPFRPMTRTVFVPWNQVNHSPWIHFQSARPPSTL